MSKSKSNSYYGNEKLKPVGHTERITVEEYRRRIREIKRCKNDIAYFAEKYFYIMTLDHGKQVIKLYPKQKEFLECLAENNMVVCLSSRQSGKTTTATIFYLWLAIFHDDQKCLVGANKFATAKEIMSRMQMAFELLPKWLVPSIVKWNVANIKFGNGSHIECVSTSSDGARGKSCGALCIDEAAWLGSKGLDFWVSTYPVISSASDGRALLISTPNGMDPLFYATYESARSGNSTWTAFRIDYWDVPGRESAEWREQQIQALGDEMRFEQEFGNSFLSTGSTLLKGTDIADYKAFLRSDDYFEPDKMTLDVLPGEFSWNQWYPYQKNHAYVIGVDTGDGTGSDYSVITVWDITDIKNITLVASFKSNVLSTAEYAYVVAKIATYYDLPYLMVEANNMGRSVLDMLVYVYYYDNIISFGGKGMGINANMKTKNNACAWFRNMHTLDGYNINIYDKQLVGEMEFFCRGKGDNSSYSAVRPNHDDHMMSSIWALYVLHRDFIDSYYDVKYWSNNKYGMPVPGEVRPFEGTYYSDSLNQIKDPDTTFMNVLENGNPLDEDEDGINNSNESRDDFFGVFNF
jgi:hypothetical protein